MNQSFEAMGTTVSLAGQVPDETLEAVRAAFEGLEDRFSLYRDDSELSRLARHEFPLTQASPELRDAYAVALTWRADTEGAFNPHRPDGVIDLSGVVKAFAIAEAGRLLEAAGSPDWVVNAGGDILAGGNRLVPEAAASPSRSAAEAAASSLSSSSQVTVGIVDPTDRTSLLTQFALSTAYPALATSGISERGEHVWRMGAWDAESDPFIQVSVAGPDILTADVLATAILAGGRPTLDLAPRRWPVEIIAVTRAGNLYCTDAFRRRAA